MTLFHQHRRSRLGPALLALAVAAGAVVALAGPRDDAPKQAVPPELDRVPRDTAAFLTVRLADLWKTPVGKSVRDALTKQRNNPLEAFEKIYGLAVTDLERVTVLVPALTSKEGARPWLLLTTTRPYDRDKVSAALQAAGARPPGSDEPPPVPEAKPTAPGAPPPVPVKPPSCGGEAEEAAAAPADALLLHDMLVVFLDDHNLLAGAPGEGSAVALLAQALRRAPHGPLDDALNQAGGHLVVGGLNPAGLPLAELARFDKLRPFLPLLAAERAMLTLDLDEDVRLEVRGRFKDAAAAREAEQAVQDLLTQARAALLQGRNELAKEPRQENAALITLLRQVDTALHNATVKLDGGQLQVGVRMKVEAALPALMAELGRQFDIARTRTQGQNNLKQIGLAFHNYHDANNYFPQAGFPGSRNPNGKPLLSWRVSILPYIEQDALYRQFNLDEPWDGPTNKKLIAQMPKLYEVPGRPAPAGMTYYQVFTGKEAPFESTRKVRIVDIPDGTSNTIMVAEAGEPAIWTKPEDLEFTKDGPLPKLLEEFTAAMMDGSVRTVNRRKVSDQTLRLAIMPNDGMPLPADW